MNLPSLSNSEIKTMSSREIAELTGKEKANVHRDIKSQLLFGLYGLDPSNLNHEQIQGLTIIPDERGYWSEVQLDRYHTDILVSGYEVKYRAKIIKRWHELENQTQKPKAVSTAEMIMLQAQWNLDQERKLLAVEKTVENQAVQLEEVNDDIAMVVKEIEGVKKLVLDSSISLEDIYADEDAFFEIGEVATVLIGSGYFTKEKDFRRYLLDKKLCYKKGNNSYHPMSALIKHKYMNTLLVKKGYKTFMATHFTPRGVSWIVKRLQAEQQTELDLGYVEPENIFATANVTPATVVRGF